MASGGSGVCISILQGYLCVWACVYRSLAVIVSILVQLRLLNSASGPRHCD